MCGVGVDVVRHGADLPLLHLFFCEGGAGRRSAVSAFAKKCDEGRCGKARDDAALDAIDDGLVDRGTRTRGRGTKVTRETSAANCQSVGARYYRYIKHTAPHRTARNATAN